MPKISLCLSPSSIDNAIKQLEQYKNNIDRKLDELTNRLALIGAKVAQVRFTNAIYDGDNDVHVSVEKTDKGYKIVASGQAVAFIEFGAGVYHNGKEPYPNPRPEGIVGIGEYGKGMGKRQAWGYRDDSGVLHITKGNPAAMPLWYASEEMRKMIEKIAREVFEQ